jgi:hypothetical protein
MRFCKKITTHADVFINLALVGRGVTDEPFDFAHGYSRGNGSEPGEGLTLEDSPDQRPNAKVDGDDREKVT